MPISKENLPTKLQLGKQSFRHGKTDGQFELKSYLTTTITSIDLILISVKRGICCR